MNESFDRTAPVEKPMPLPYAQPLPRLRFIRVLAGILCFYAMLMTFTHGFPILKTAFASGADHFLISIRYTGDPVTWFILQILGFIKGVLLILAALALGNLRRRAVPLALAYLSIEAVCIGMYVYFEIQQLLTLGSITARLMLDRSVELLLPLFLSLALIVLLIYAFPSGRRS